MLIIDHSTRVFQMWAYTAGMGRLLLRSTKSGGPSNTRIDVLFQNVKVLKLPTLLHGLTVAEADSVVASKISQETGLLAGDETLMFAIRTSTYEGYVVASVCVEHEDDGEYFDPSVLWPDLR